VTYHLAASLGIPPYTVMKAGFAPVTRDGLVGRNGRLWSEDRRLVATGSGQCLCRRVPSAR